MKLCRSLMSSTILRRVVQRLDSSRLCLRAFTERSIAALDAKNEGIKKPKPKTVPIPKITLISPNDSITVTILEDAQRLAKRRNLILTKVTDLDSKTQRAIYKLTSNISHVNRTEKATEAAEDVKNDDKDKQKFKEVKLLYISAKITEHDLSTKIKKVVKLLDKQHKVKLVITLDDSHEDKVTSIIKNMVKDHGSIQQMPSKKHTILFVITPLMRNDDSPSSKGTSASS